MRILAIGGSGFIGRHVVEALHLAGHRVAVFHRGGTSSLPSGVVAIPGDRRDLLAHRGPLRAFAPDVVVDFILSSGAQAAALVATMRGFAGRVVALSSMDVYRAASVLHRLEPGPLVPLPLTEESPLRRVEKTYPPELVRRLQETFGWLDEDYDKVAVERAVAVDPDLPATVLRLPMVYGPGDKLHRLAPLLKRIDDGRKAILFEERLSKWRAPRGYVENVAFAVVLAATDERAKGRVYNVAEENAYSELEWAERVCRAAGYEGEIVVLPADRAPEHLIPPGNPDQHWVADSSRIRRELGYREPVALDEALRRTIDWERKHPPEQLDARQFDYPAEDAALSSARGA